MVHEYDRIALCLLYPLTVPIVGVLKDRRSRVYDLRKPVVVVVRERPGGPILREQVPVGIVGVGRRPGIREPVEGAVGVRRGRQALHHLYPVPHLVVRVGDCPPEASG